MATPSMDFSDLTPHQRDFATWLAETHSLVSLDNYALPGATFSRQAIMSYQPAVQPTTWYQTYITNTSDSIKFYPPVLDIVPYTITTQTPWKELSSSVQSTTKLETIPGEQFIAEELFPFYCDYVGGPTLQPSWWRLRILMIFTFARTIQGVLQLATP